jgi:hypothetical protein
MSMENFFNWVTKPMSNEDVEIWFNMNNMTPEKGELFFDFCHSLYGLMGQTYLGGDDARNETNVSLNDEDKRKHFQWCWNTTIGNFKKENIKFSTEGEHYEYFISFFLEVFYNQKNKSVKESVGVFIKELFDKNKTFTKSDIDLYTEIYKLLDKNILN